MNLEMQAQGSAQNAVSGARVLIVEDEAVVAIHLRQELSKLGYIVTGVATSGNQALKLLEETCPDVVLMDIHIQGQMDGIETARRIPRYLHVPVIYLTAYAEDATLTKAGETNPYGYLIKPILDREVHATVKMALIRSRMDESIRENEGILFRALCSSPVSVC